MCFFQKGPFFEARGVFWPPLGGGSPPKSGFWGVKNSPWLIYLYCCEKGGPKRGSKRAPKRPFCPKREFGSTFSWYSTHSRLIFGPKKNQLYTVKSIGFWSKKRLFWPFSNYSTFSTRFWGLLKPRLPTLRFQIFWPPPCRPSGARRTVREGPIVIGG